MDTHETRPRLRRPNLAALATAFLAALVLSFGFAASTAQSSQDNPAQDEEEGRKFENGIPEHVPLKVKLKNEQAFKDKKNKEWGRDLEIEVRNTGQKPIYYMYMIILFEDFVMENGAQVGFRVKYGRQELWDLEEAILPDDVPLRPGETYTFKIPEEKWRGFKTIRDERGRGDPKRVRFEMQFITFGDGTGLESTLGGPMLPPQKKRSRKEPPPKQGANVCRPARDARTLAPPAKILKASAFLEPADLLRVSFFPPEPAAPPTSALDCNCQNVPNCFFGVIQCSWQCPCDNPCAFPTHVSTGNCSTSTGKCRQVQLAAEPCETRFNGTQECSFDRIINFGCGVGDPPAPPPPSPAGSPSPAPSPSATPAPTPNLATRPNPTNCFWNDLLVPAHWVCLCSASEYADYPRYGQANLGCPFGKVNDGRDCCQCSSGELDCPHGYVWNTIRCACCDSSGQCLGDSTAGCTAEECQGDVPEGGVQSDTGPCPCASPILLDVRGDGFRLTDLHGGVRFDLNGDGRAGRLAWTAAGTDDAWLALDRDGDGRITSGRELFGHLTAQPDPPAGESRNGFLALAEFDRAAGGGNSDRSIDSGDAVFAHLRLWRDADHDGLSEPGELFTLPALGVARLHLSYKESKRVDEHGNRFRYRAKADDAKGSGVNRWAWDVFLLAGP